MIHSLFTLFDNTQTRIGDRETITEQSRIRRSDSFDEKRKYSVDIQFTRLTQWGRRIGFRSFLPVTRSAQWSTACRRLSLCRCNNGQGIEGGTVGAFCRILVHYFYQSSRDIGSRRNNAFRHVVIVRSRRSRKPTAHLRPYEYGIPSFVPKDPSVSRASLLSLLSIRSIFGNFVLLDTMSGGIEAIKIGRINCWNAWISSREERIETLVGISINTVDRNAYRQFGKIVFISNLCVNFFSQKEYDVRKRGFEKRWRITRGINYW